MTETRSEQPQRASLRFCKAFFEIRDADDTHRRLLEAGAQELIAEPRQRWYVWEGPGSGSPFLVRTRGARLVLEGPDAATIGRAWRRLDEQLQPAARARVAAGDNLARFVPRPRVRTADRPENFSAAHEAQVLAEFYAAVVSRWADTPQQRLGGMSPRQAVTDPDASALLTALLERMRSVERERRARGMASLSVDELERSLFDIEGLAR